MLVRTALAQRAGEPSLGRALDVFDDYLSLRAAGPRSPAAAGADLARQVAERRALRRRYLAPPVVHAFYAEDEASEDYALLRAREWARSHDRKSVERASSALLTPARRAERAQTFVLERLGWEEEEGSEPGTWADLSAFDEGAPVRLAELRRRQAAFAERRAAFAEARRAHPDASEAELHALAQRLGLDERDFARVSAFAPTR
jgi:lipase chaperone LimK